MPIVPLHPELLIEIAVINFATPPDTDRAATHESLDCCRIKCFDENLHVVIQAIAMAQVSGKPADRKIREGIEPVKHNSKMLLHLSFVIAFKFVLWRRQKYVHRIVNQMQRQT